MARIDGSFGRFFQLGYVTRDIHRAIEALTGRMGARQIDIFEDFSDEAGNPVALRCLAHLSLGGAEIEVIQPRLDWPSIYLDALPEGDNPLGLHHLGYMHPDIAGWDEAMRLFRAEGIAVPMEGATSRARFAYLDTRSEVGHYSELVYRAPA